MNSCNLYKTTLARVLFLIIGLTLLAGCGDATHVTGTAPPAPGPLSANNVNLIFVVSEDLAYKASGDVNRTTANLTSQGLQRSLQMATFLKQQVLGSKNVTQVYTLEPMTHPQAAGNYPDMVAIETIQQFALLNQITLSDVGQPLYSPYTGNSYPINASYAASEPVPSGVATPAISCPGCQGLDFNDPGGDNETLATGIITANAPGFYVFSAPWETTNALMGNINRLESYNLTIPASYASPNYIYAISITTSGSASLVTYNSNLNPSSSYPTLPSPAPVSTPCAAQTPFIIDTSITPGAVIPEGINTNETLYMIRHAEAHPQGNWDDGNYVCAGQWRALDLPNALSGKLNPSPQQVYSIDPAQGILGTENDSGNPFWSYVRPSLTVEPYAIANNLPYGLAASFDLFSSPLDVQLQQAVDFFFFDGQFSNQTVLMAWEHAHIPPTITQLVSSYFPHGGAPPVPDWPGGDYDTIWTVTLDSQGNLTVNNYLCEGIDSTALPATCPQF